MYILNKFPGKSFTLYVFIQYYLLQTYILMPTPTDMDPPMRVHQLSPIFAISGWLMEI